MHILDDFLNLENSKDRAVHKLKEQVSGIFRYFIYTIQRRESNTYIPIRTL